MKMNCCTRLNEKVIKKISDNKGYEYFNNGVFGVIKSSFKMNSQRHTTDE